MDNDNKRFIALVATSLGLISSVLTLFTLSFSKLSMYVGGVILAMTAIALCVVYKWMPKGNLPDGMVDIVEELEQNSRNARFKIVFPCDDQYFEGANKLAREKFGKNSVSRRTVNDWKKRNELILTCLLDNNRLVGYFDILPLKNDFAQKLIKGEVGEKDIRAEDILGPHDIRNAEYIYFAGIAVQNTFSGQGCIYGSYLLASAVEYVRILYSSGKVKKILTIPTSDCGLKLTKKLNFALEREGGLRKDGYDLYSKNFNIDEINALIASKRKVYERFDLSAYSITPQLGYSI